MWCEVMWCKAATNQLKLALSYSSLGWTLHSTCCYPTGKGLRGGISLKKKAQLQICAKEDFRVESSQPGYWHTASVQPTFCLTDTPFCWNLALHKTPTSCPMTSMPSKRQCESCVWEPQIILTFHPFHPPICIQTKCITHLHSIHL